MKLWPFQRSELSDSEYQEYRGPQNIKVTAKSFDEAAKKILKRLRKVKDENSERIRRHRFFVNNKTTKYYLVGPKNTFTKTGSFIPSPLDTSSKYKLKRVCKGINIAFDDDIPDDSADGGKTIEQKLLEYIDQRWESYVIWKLINSNDDLKYLVFGLKSHDNSFVEKKGGNYAIGIRGEGNVSVPYDLGIVGSIIGWHNFVQKQKDEVKVDKDVLKRRIKMLEKNLINLETENEKLRNNY